MKRFTVRIYGLLIVDDAVLVSDELIKGTHVVKFPGGGMEFGEGTIECLKREFMEELNMEIEVSSHFYTTDFHVVSAFDDNCQVMSIYYRVEAKQPIIINVSENLREYKLDNGRQGFRWIPLNKISEADFTFAIDKKVGKMLSSME